MKLILNNKLHLDVKIEKKDKTIADVLQRCPAKDNFEFGFAFGFDKKENKKKLSLNSNFTKYEVVDIYDKKEAMKYQKKVNMTAGLAIALYLKQHFSSLNLSVVNVSSDSDNFFIDLDNANSYENNDIAQNEELAKQALLKVKNIKETKIAFAKEIVKNKYQLHYLNEAFNLRKEISSYSSAELNSSIKLEACNLLNIQDIKFAKITNISGVYFLNDKNNKVLKRITGFAAETKDEIKDILTQIDQQSQHDHRSLNKILNFYYLDSTILPGLPFWLPAGVKLIEKINMTWRYFERKFEYNEVLTPILGSEGIYQQSGHLKHYKNIMFPALKTEHNVFYLRPMTCPHHILLFASNIVSYSQLPMRYCEVSMLFRSEPSGSLKGIERTRCMNLVDSHVFAMEKQIEEEVLQILTMIKKCLDYFGIKISRFVLSMHDKGGKYHDAEDLWKKAEQKLENCLKQTGTKYEKIPGEAAFYGPKIDIEIETVQKTKITVSTVQLDYNLPESFNIHYFDANNKKVRPVIIHHGIIGTYERFIAVLIEQYGTNFPFWLSSRQVAIIPINAEKHNDYAKKIFAHLKQNHINVLIDEAKDHFNNKVRKYQVQKFNYIVIIGDREIKNKQVSVRNTYTNKIETYDLNKFYEKIDLENEKLSKVRN